MEIWQDGVLAGLAAVGLTAILWLLAGLLFRRRERLLDAVYLVPLSGGAEQLDMTLRELSRERALPVVLVDCGLTAAGRQRGAGDAAAADRPLYEERKRAGEVSIWASAVPWRAPYSR